MAQVEPHARTGAAEAGVAGGLVLAIAAVEGGLRLPADRVTREDEHVPVAGILERRRGAFNSLQPGAEPVP